MSAYLPGEIELRAQSILNVERRKGITQGEVVYLLKEEGPFEWVIRRSIYLGVEKPEELDNVFLSFKEAKDRLMTIYEDFLNQALKLGVFLEHLTEQSDLEYGSGTAIFADDTKNNTVQNYRIKRINEVKKLFK
ncbi:MAG: hypothetical protein R2827_01995 [Bdellovibrionales bacterium]